MDAGEERRSGESQIDGGVMGRVLSGRNENRGTLL